MILLCLLRLTFVKKKKKIFLDSVIFFSCWADNHRLEFLRSLFPLFLCLQFRQTSAFNGAALITVSVAAVSLIDAGIRQTKKKNHQQKQGKRNEIC